jgi:AcrR family transcriptional regulator
VERIRPPGAADADAEQARPLRLPAARRRRQLLVAAIELFGAQGYHDTSMEDIADEAGVTKPVLYQHFPSKRELYVELLEGVGRDLSATMAATVGRETAPSQRVRAVFVAYFRFVSEQTAAFQLLFGTGARGTDEFADVIRSLEDEIAEIISDLIDAGADAEHRHTVAYAIVGSAEVTARHWVLAARDADGTAGRRLPRLDPLTGDLLARRLADLVWAGLRAAPGGQAEPSG